MGFGVCRARLGGLDDRAPRCHQPCSKLCNFHTLVTAQGTACAANSCTLQQPPQVRRCEMACADREMPKVGHQPCRCTTVSSEHGGFQTLLYFLHVLGGGMNKRTARPANSSAILQTHLARATSAFVPSLRTSERVVPLKLTLINACFDSASQLEGHPM